MCLSTSILGETCLDQIFNFASMSKSLQIF